MMLMIFFEAYSQDSTTLARLNDSCKNAIANAKHDTTRVKIYVEWDNLIYISDPKLDHELNKKIESICYHNLKLKLNKKERNSFNRSLAYAWMGLGIESSSMGDYARAMQYYLSSLKIFEKLKDRYRIASVYINIGNLYTEQDDVKRAIQYLTKSRDILMELNDKHSLATCLTNIGTAYLNAKDYENAILNYNECLKVSRDIGNKRSEVFTIINLAELYGIRGKFELSKKHADEGMTLAGLLNDDLAKAFAYNVNGSLMAKTNNYKAAISNYNKALFIAKKISAIIEAAEASENLYRCYKAIGDSKSALEMRMYFIKIRDSLQNADAHREILRHQYQYEYEKKTAKDSVRMHEEKILNATLLKNEQTKRYALYGGIGLTIIFGIFMFNRLKIARRQKSVIEYQKIKVEQQKLIVEEKQLQVMNSIHYARRIQNAILPSDKHIQKDLERLNN